MSRKVIPLTAWESVHGYPSTAQLRWLRFNGHENGFNRAVRKVGKRVLIDEAAFFEWLDEQSEEQARAGR